MSGAMRLLVVVGCVVVFSAASVANQAAPAGCGAKSDCLEVVFAGLNYFDSTDEPPGGGSVPEPPAAWPPPGTDYVTALPFANTSIFLTETDGKTRSDKVSVIVTPDPNKPGFNFVDIKLFSDPANFGAVGPNDINEDGKTPGFPIIAPGMPHAGYIDVTKALFPAGIPAGSALDAVFVYSDPSPEPSSAALLATGIAGLGCSLWRRRTRA